MKKLKNNKAITLLALVITIIVLLILAGVTISTLTGENGILNRSKNARITQIISEAEENLKVKVMEVQHEKNGQATLQDFVNYLDADDSITVEIAVSPKTASSTGITDINGLEDIYVTYNNCEFKVNSILEISYVDGSYEKLALAETTESTGITVTIKAKITITDVQAKSFVVNVDAGEDASKVALYQYYIDDKLVYEGKETQYTVTGLSKTTNYKVNVKAVPRTTMDLGTLQQQTEDKQTITIADKFDKYIYIDSINGNDSTGDGTKEKPYATLSNITKTTIIERDYTYAIMLGEGTYKLDSDNLFAALNCNKSINIIGKNNKTEISATRIFGASYGGGTTAYAVNFYRLVWNANNYTNSSNVIFTSNPMSFSAVLFKNLPEVNDTAYFLPSTSMEFNNCTLVKKSANLLRTTHGTIKLTNCYGGFTSGYATTDDKWNYQTNYITATPQIDGTTYMITEEESKWKGVGTGTNPDGTKANLGVYGGTYSWEFDTDLD